MSFENLADHLKTSPIQAPNSLSGVRSQLRYYGNAAPTGSQGASEVQSRADGVSYQLDAASNLAQMQQRISEIQLGASRSDTLVQLGQAQDKSSLSNQKLELSRGTTLDALSRGLVGVSAVGEAAAGIAGDLAKMTGSETLKHVQSFLENIPMFGANKQSRVLNQLQDEVKSALEKGDKAAAEYANRSAEAASDLAKTNDDSNGEFTTALGGYDAFESFFPNFPNRRHLVYLLRRGRLFSH